MDPSSSHMVSVMTCVLRLDTQTSGWDKSMHKLLKGIQDVTYRIDATRGIAYLSGKISPDIILRFRKVKKHAQLIHLYYGHVNPSETVPIGFSQPDPPPPPQYTYTEQPPVAYPYYYYGPEVLYSFSPQLPTRDGITGEPQCRIL